MKKIKSKLVGLCAITMLGVFSGNCVSADAHAPDLCYSFEEIQNGQATDSSENTIAAILNGGAVSTSGIKGNGIFMNGTDSYLEVDSAVVASYSNNMSLVFWFKPKVNSIMYGDGGIVKNGRKLNIFYDYQSRKIMAEMHFTGQEINLRPEFVFTNDVWYQIALVRDAGSVKMYINSMLVAEANITGTNLAGVSEMLFGYDEYSYFRGCIDEIAFYKKTIDEQQIKEMYHKVTENADIADVKDFPFSAIYNNGILPVSADFFRSSNLKKPINAGFESRDEVFSAYADGENGNVYISEESNNGKFALGIAQKENKILAVKESEYFNIGEKPGTNSLFKLYKDMIENNFVISAVLEPGSVVEMNIYNEEGTFVDGGSAEISRNGELNHRYALDNGYYRVLIYYYPDPLGEYETYEYYINLVDQSLYTTTDITDIGKIDMKSNLVSMMVKPGENAEYITFYTKAQLADDSGELYETYVPVKSDKNNDGVYKIGEDLSRGEWQEIILNLGDIDEAINNNAASGLYMCANIGSKWLFDDVKTQYKKVKENTAVLNDSVKDNVVYEEGLRFQKIDANGYSYKNSPAVIDGTISVSEDISSFAIDDGYIALEKKAETVTSDKPLHEFDFADERCVVYENGYDNEYTGKSMKSKKFHTRTENPEIPASKSLIISRRADIESQYRIVFITKTTLTVTDSNGNIKQYSSDYDKYYYSDWYDGDITISASYNLSTHFTIKEIQYIAKDEQIDNILMDRLSAVNMNIDGIETFNRTRINITAKIDGNYSTDTSKVQALQIALYENEAEEPYYFTNITFAKNTDDNQIETAVLPRIRNNTIVELKNLDNSDSLSQLLRIDNIVLMEIENNSLDSYAEYINGYTISNNTYSSALSIGDIVPEDEMYAITHMNTKAEEADEITVDATKCAVVRYINLGNASEIDGKMLDYGEGIIILTNTDSSSKTYELTGDNFYIISQENYSIPEEGVFVDNQYFLFVDGLDASGDFYKLSQDTETVYYINRYENNYLYKYSFSSKEYTEVLSEPVKYLAVSPDETLCAVKTNSENKIINLLSGESQIIKLSGNYEFSGSNELHSITISTGNIKWEQNVNGEVMEILNTENDAIRYGYAQYDFDSTGNNIVFAYKSGTGSGEINVEWYERYNGIWTLKKSFETEKTSATTTNKIHLTDDLSTIILGFKSIDLRNETVSETNINGYIKAEINNQCIIYSDNYYLYNPTTDEKYKMFSAELPEQKSIAYNPDSNIITYMSKNGGFVRKYFDSKQPDVKYLLSFDGRKTWSTYKNGRWEKVLEGAVPGETELSAMGMTAEEINKIKPSAINSLYNDGKDVLSVDFAAYMSSNSNKISPNIKKVSVFTLDDTQFPSLYSINIKRFEKSDYKTVESLFPIENISNGGECYYLLYIGNDWLYTYHDGKLVKVIETAEELLKDPDSGWTAFKQYGMSANELRSVPESVLSDLLVNPNYANSEFGVIYVIKSDKELDNNTVELKIKGRSELLAGSDVVVEILMNGNDKKVISSAEFAKEDIEKLLDWLSKRQSGSGDIFFNIKNDTVQHLINYYMINSINIYNASEYNEAQPEEESASEEVAITEDVNATEDVTITQDITITENANDTQESQEIAEETD